MLAHAHTASSAGLRPRARRAGVVLQLFRTRAMTRPAEVAEMDALLGRVAATPGQGCLCRSVCPFCPPD